MTLKDRVTEALAATAPENTRRRDALNAALNAGDTDRDIHEALVRLIEAREQKAIALEKNGQAAQAKAERDDAAALRSIADPSSGGGSGNTPSGGPSGGKRGPTFTTPQKIIGAVVLAALAVAVYFMVTPSDQVDLSKPPADKQIAVFHDDHTMGDPKAPITVLEYASPMCPFCGRFALEEFPAFKREFIDTGRVFYIYRMFPLGAPDGAVEGIARCLPKERYFDYYEMMYREQPQWDPDGYDIPDVEGAIIKLAAREGLSPEKAKACMYDRTNQERINQVAQDALVRYQITGTPTFIMNGQIVNFPTGKTRLEILRLRINSLSSGAVQ